MKPSFSIVMNLVYPHANYTVLVNKTETCDIFMSAKMSALNVYVTKMKHLRILAIPKALISFISADEVKFILPDWKLKNIQLQRKLKEMAIKLEKNGQ